MFFFDSSLILYEDLAMSSAENEQHRENLRVSNISSNYLLSFPICSTHYEMTSTNDEEVGHFILRFSSSPSSPSPPPAAATKTILIDQFLVIHAIAWLVVDEFDVFHLFLVINGLQKFVADRADFDHDL